MRRALLFDLDETLMVEEPAAVAAFAATAQHGTEHRSLDPLLLATAAREKARELWYAAATHEYCMRVGISSWEGLWCRFEGEDEDTRALRDWSPTYRREAWRLALSDQGIDDIGFAEELAARFVKERRARHQVFGDAPSVLAGLKGSYRLAVVTNGAACLQREKLAAGGLTKYFDVIVVSADLGAAKPDPAVFQNALDELDVENQRAVMVGDSLRKDVDGARAAGLGAVWVNRTGEAAPPDRSDLVEVQTLRDLPTALG
jgi:putative hydrolase of the HAD superfamily